MIKLILIVVAIVALVVGLWVMALTIHFRRQAEAPKQRFTPPETEAKVDTSPTELAPTPAPTAIPIDVAKAMVSVDYKWQKTAFDTIMTVDFVFINQSPYQAKDITVTCTHYAPSGTEIDSNTRTIYEVIPAKGIKKVNDFNMGFIHSQASSTKCKIDHLEM